MKQIRTRSMAFLLAILILFTMLPYAEPMAFGSEKETHSTTALFCAVHFDFSTTYLTQGNYKKTFSAFSANAYSLFHELNLHFWEYNLYWQQYNLTADHRKKLQALIPQYFNGSKYKDESPFC